MGLRPTKNNQNGRGVRRTSAAGQRLIIGEIKCGHASGQVIFNGAANTVQ